MHYEDSLLGNLYFIDPQWLCDLLVCIMTAIHKSSMSNDGMYGCVCVKLQSLAEEATESKGGHFAKLKLFSIAKITILW